jgi:hypothetical protein
VLVLARTKRPSSQSDNRPPLYNLAIPTAALAVGAEQTLLDSGEGAEPEVSARYDDARIAQLRISALLSGTFGDRLSSIAALDHRYFIYALGSGREERVETRPPYMADNHTFRRRDHPNGNRNTATQLGD